MKQKLHKTKSLSDYFDGIETPEPIRTPESTPLPTPIPTDTDTYPINTEKNGDQSTTVGTLH